MSIGRFQRDENGFSGSLKTLPTPVSARSKTSSTLANVVRATVLAAGVAVGASSLEACSAVVSSTPVPSDPAPPPQYNAASASETPPLPPNAVCEGAREDNPCPVVMIPPSPDEAQADAPPTAAADANPDETNHRPDLAMPTAPGIGHDLTVAAGGYVAGRQAENSRSTNAESPRPTGARAETGGGRCHDGGGRSGGGGTRSPPLGFVGGEPCGGRRRRRWRCRKKYRRARGSCRRRRRRRHSGGESGGGNDGDRGSDGGRGRRSCGRCRTCRSRNSPQAN